MKGSLPTRNINETTNKNIWSPGLSPPICVHIVRKRTRQTDDVHHFFVFEYINQCWRHTVKGYHDATRGIISVFPKGLHEEHR